MKPSANTEIRERLDTLRDQQFEVRHFMDIAEKYSKSYHYVRNLLNQFHKECKLVIIRKIPNKTGGEPVKVFGVAVGATFKIKSSTETVNEHRAKVKAQEKRLKDCLDRIDNAMAGWAR